MTNEELKKKICEIIAPYVSAWGEDERIADALIDANIFVDIDTLKDEQQSMNGILTSMSSYMNYKLHELERRAEVAEKALKNRAACHILKQFPNETDELENLTQEVYEAWIKQAEKELAEERKDD